MLLQALQLVLVALFMEPLCSVAAGLEPGSPPITPVVPAAPPVPAVSQPIPVTARSWPWMAANHTRRPIDLSQLGYIEEEYIIKGRARVLDWPSIDHLDSLAEGPYVTRILVRRPIDPQRFSGTAWVEPLNPSMRYDLALVWGDTHHYLVSHGDIWVGVTVKPVAIQSLKEFDPRRYASLKMPNPLPPRATCPQSVLPMPRGGLPPESSPRTENGLIWDILSQTGAWLRHPGDNSPLHRFHLQRLFMVGDSQSGAFVLTYANAIHPFVLSPTGGSLYDGYIATVASGPSTPIRQCEQPIPKNDPRRVIQPRGVPIMTIVSETEMVAPRRRPDSDRPPDLFRGYEVAGASHVHETDGQDAPAAADAAKTQGSRFDTNTGCTQQGAPPNDVPIGMIIDGALANLDRWTRDGTAPPHGRPIEQTGGTGEVQRDSFGNALGGVRTPALDVPTARYHPRMSGPGVCELWGYREPFSAAQLKSLYPSHGEYLDKVRADVTDLVAQRWLTARDGDRILTAASAMAASPTAEVLYQHGKVYTVDHSGTVAQAIAFADGKVTYVGTDAGAKALIGDHMTVIDLGGRTVMPGLIDGHMHPVAAGMDLLKCNLNYASLTLVQLQARLQACLDERRNSEGPDAWLEVVNWFRYGMGAEAAGVDRKALDALKTQRPIIVHDSFGHSSLVNSRALVLAKITAQTRDPVGGRIDRDAAGNPTGIMEDAAQESINALLPKPTAADHVAGARAAVNALRQQGVTTFLDAVGTDEDIEAFAAVEREGALTARAHFAPLIRPADVPNVEAARNAVAKLVATAKKYDEGAIRPTPSITVHQAKLFMDGVITAPANTGALLEPYLVNHGTAQSPKFEPAPRREPDVYFPVPILTQLLIGLGREHIDPHLHTDGDGAVRAGLDAVQAMRAALPGLDVRPAFAHCELVDPADYPRFAELNVIPVLSFQWEKPASDTIDGARDSLGPRRWPLIEPAGWLAQKGARIAYGSDWPVDPLDEWFALQVGVTRKGRPDAPPKYSGRLGKDPGLSQSAVIQAITLNAAYELREERYIGSLEVGKLADLIVLDRDVETIAPEQISGTKVLRTVVGGRVVYDSGALQK